MHRKTCPGNGTEGIRSDPLQSTRSSMEPHIHEPLKKLKHATSSRQPLRNIFLQFFCAILNSQCRSTNTETANNKKQSDLEIFGGLNPKPDDPAMDLNSSGDTGCKYCNLHRRSSVPSRVQSSIIRIYEMRTRGPQAPPLKLSVTHMATRPHGIARHCTLTPDNTGYGLRPETPNLNP